MKVSGFGRDFITGEFVERLRRNQQPSANADAPQLTTMDKFVDRLD
jgi:hypothetical protein